MTSIRGNVWARLCDQVSGLGPEASEAGSKSLGKRFLRGDVKGDRQDLKRTFSEWPDDEQSGNTLGDSRAQLFENTKNMFHDQLKGVFTLFPSFFGICQ